MFKAEWHDPIYHANFILVTCPFKELNPWIRKTYGKDCAPTDDDMLPNGRTHFFGADNKQEYVMFWFPPDIDLKHPQWLATIAHEAFHGTSFILRSRDLKHTATAEEAWAYYIGYLVGRITRHLTESKKPLTPKKRRAKVGKR